MTASLHVLDDVSHPIFLASYAAIQNIFGSSQELHALTYSRILKKYSTLKETHTSLISVHKSM
jgi:hypothetical protein